MIIESIKKIEAKKAGDDIAKKSQQESYNAIAEAPSELENAVSEAPDNNIALPTMSILDNDPEDVVAQVEEEKGGDDPKTIIFGKELPN